MRVCVCVLFCFLFYTVVRSTIFLTATSMREKNVCICSVHKKSAQCTLSVFTYLDVLVYERLCVYHVSYCFMFVAFVCIV